MTSKIKPTTKAAEKKVPAKVPKKTSEKKSTVKAEESKKTKLSKPHLVRDSFTIPESEYAAWSAKARGESLEASWNQLFEAYAAQYPEFAAEFQRRRAHQLPPQLNEVFWQQALTTVQAEQPKIATRQASDRKSTRLNSSHTDISRMPSSA